MKLLISTFTDDGGWTESVEIDEAELQMNTYGGVRLEIAARGRLRTVYQKDDPRAV